MLSLPEDWDYSLAGLCSISKESRDGIRAILKELQEHHYVEIEKVRGNKGYFKYNYLIYEIPHFIREEDNNNNSDIENYNGNISIDALENIASCLKIEYYLLIKNNQYI